MNRQDLILKFSKINSVDAIDSKVLFEILLIKVSNRLSVGQSISIPDFGYLHKIKGKIKKPSFGYSQEGSEEKIDLLLYSESKILSESESKGFVFNIPFSEDEDYESIDSHFSLSIGKPVIPLRGTLSIADFIPSSGSEYRKHLESKVDSLLSKSDVSFSDEEFPVLVIDASSYVVDEIKLEKVEDELDKILSDEKENIVEETDTTTTQKVQNIAWDFGEYYSEKISPESIMEVANEKISDSEANKTLQTLASSAAEDNDEQIEKVLDELLEGDDQSTITEEEVSSIGVSPELDASKLLDDLNDYEEVKFDGSGGVIDVDDKSDEEFWKSASKLFETYNPREIRKDNGSTYTEVRSTSIDIKDDGEVSSSKIKLARDDESNIKPSKSESKNDFIQAEKSKKKSKVWIYAAVIFFIITAALGTYWYTQVYIKNKNLALRNDLKLDLNNANIIGRDYGVPVSFPYTKAGTELVNVNDSTQSGKDISETKNKVVEVEGINKSSSEGLQRSQQFVPSERPVSLGNNIYRYGKIYFVQVASFKSNSIAENEAGKYRNRGYNSFVESTEIPGRGIWYRIKVGNFSSLEEAKNFIDKNYR